MSSALVSEDIVESHPITQALLKMGVTCNQLAEIRFRRPSDPAPLSQRPITWPVDFPLSAIPLALPYCALNSLTDPTQSSEDRANALECVQSERARLMELDLNRFATAFAERKNSDSEKDRLFRAEQSRRARQPRAFLNEEGLTLNKLIRRMIGKPHCKGLSTDELWNRLFHEFDKEGLDPKRDSKGNSADKERINYYPALKDSREKTIGKRHFNKLLAQARK